MYNTAVMTEETKKCKTCYTDIPKKAKKCPNCRADQRNWFRRHPIITLIIFSILFIQVINTLSRVEEQVNKETNREQVTSKSSKYKYHEGNADQPLGVYIINTDLGDGGSIADSTPIFRGEEADATQLVTQVPNGAEVKLLKRRTDGDSEWDRCLIKYKEFKGWLSCDWLQEKKN